MRLIDDAPDLAGIQDMFASAIFESAMPLPAAIWSASSAAATSRFVIYRNNVLVGLLNALSMKFPVVRKLLWEDSFQRIAREYVTTEPPKSPVLLEYGESFPHFIRKSGPSAASEYVADVAALEAARVRAYHAADAKPMGRNALAALPPDQLAHMRLLLHPSVGLVKSRFPVVGIWEANRGNGDNSIACWKSESALVARPHRQVMVHRLSAGGYEFLAALQHGETIAEAVRAATEATCEFALAECLTTVIVADIVVGIIRPLAIDVDLLPNRL
jgi:hypothetical protein